MCSDRLGSCFMRENTRSKTFGNGWGRLLNQILVEKKILEPCAEPPYRKNIGNRGRQF